MMPKKETIAKKIASSAKVNAIKKTDTNQEEGSGYTENIVSEAVVAYQPLYANPISLLSSSKKGLNAKAAIDFINLSGFTQEEFQETFKTTVKTIQNYSRQDFKLDAPLSEKLLKSFALFEKGIEVFGFAKDFNEWLHQPAFGLGNQIPFEMMDTITGIGLVEEELVRIAYGDLA